MDAVEGECDAWGTNWETFAKNKTEAATSAETVEGPARLAKSAVGMLQQYRELGFSDCRLATTDEVFQVTEMAEGLCKDLLWSYATMPLEFAAIFKSGHSANLVRALEHVDDVKVGGRSIKGRSLVGVARAEEKVEQEVKFAKSFRALKRVIGGAGEGKVWHHVVEQRGANISRFGAEAIHNTTNVVAVPRQVNQALANYYSTVQPFTRGRTVRQWLGSQSWRQQFEYGQKMLQKAIAGQPLP